MNRWLIGTFAALGAGLGLVLWQVKPTYDLAYFLPAPATEQQSVLVERLGQGAGARLVFIEISDTGASDASQLASRLKDILDRSGLFLRVENGQRDVAVDSIPNTIWRSRYLMADIDWSQAAIRDAMLQRVADLRTIGGPEVSRLIAEDPLWAAPQVLEKLQLGGAEAHPRWSEGQTRAFLIAETIAPPFDMTGQEKALAAVRNAYRDVSEGGGRIDLFGVGVYGRRVQEVIQSESQLLGLFAFTGVMLIIIFAYRSWRLTLISVVPLASAVLGGLAASSIAFGKIHGITIAFGATLLGVVDDYPMHLFSHARHMPARITVRLMLRTLLASAGTAIVAYAALLVSGSRGLAQLGVFSLAGILCAMAVTCWVLPKLMPETSSAVPHDDTAQEFRLTLWIWPPLLVLSFAGLVATGGIHWNDNLGEMTPLPPALLARDHAMRQRFGAPDVRYLISVTGESAEAALERTEALERTLEQARKENLIGSWSAVTTLLPSAATQEQRRGAIPSPATLQSRMTAASVGLPFRPEAFSPFLAAAARSRTLPVLGTTDLAEGFLGDYVASHFGQSNGKWRSVVFLTGLDSPDTLARWLQDRDTGAELVDLKSASESLIRGYRQRLTATLAGALVLIAGLVLWATGGIGRFVWSAMTVVASVVFTLAVVNWLHGALTLFHLISLVLVAGLGVDYCLFYSRPDVTRTEFLDTRHAVAACAATTAGAFAILGTSSIPLLSTIGSTVAIGTFTMLVAARAGCKAMPGPDRDSGAL